MEITILAEFDWVLLAQKLPVHLKGIAIIFAMFSGLAGVAAIIGGALLWVKEKTDVAGTWGAIVAFAGGAWCGYGWFGWPFISSKSQVMTSPGGLFSPPKYGTVTHESFSRLALLGNVAFGVVGVIACVVLVGCLCPELLLRKKEASKAFRM